MAKNRLGAVFLLALALGIIWWVGLPTAPDFFVETTHLLEAPLEGGLAPSFEAQTLRGEHLQISRDLGHPLIITFWATWCAPCVAEMPQLNALFQVGIPVVGINAGLEDHTTIQEWVDLHQIEFPIVQDDRSLEALYRVTGLPSTFFIDQNGIIRYVQRGAWSPQTLAEGLNRIRPEN